MSASAIVHPNATPTRRIALLATLVYLPLFGWFGDAVPDLFSHLMVLAVALTSLQTGRRASYDIAVDLSVIFVVVPPYLYDALAGSDKYGIIVALSYVFLHAFRSVVSRVLPERPRHHHPLTASAPALDMAWLFLLLASLVIAALFSASLGDKLSFSLPLFASLVILERRLQIGLSLRDLYIRLGVYGAVVLAFTFFIWGGFGRLMIGVFLAAPFLLANRYVDVKLRSWQVGLFAPFMLVAAHYSRFEEGGQINEDSGVGHYQLTMQMIDSASWRVAQGWHSFWDQYSLFWLQWVPRETWPDKPIGLGLSFVDDWIGRQGYSEGHSVATGFVGEQLWLLGSFWPLGILIVFVSILAGRALSRKIAAGFVTPLIVFDLYLTTFLWGGMASFGARWTVSLIPIIPLIWLVSKYRVPAPPVPDGQPAS